METINPDRLMLRIYSNVELDNLEVLFYKYDNNFSFEDYKKANNNYHENRVISYNNIGIATLHYSYRLNKQISHIKFFKKALYLNRKQIRILMNLMYEYDFNYGVSNLEICVDADNINSHYKPFYDAIIESNIKQPKGHHIFAGREIYNGGYIPDQDQTFYFRHINPKHRQTSLRLENKSNVIKNNKSDRFLLDWLELEGLNVDRNIYRSEIIYKGADAFRTTQTKLYYSCIDVNKEPISKYKKDKLHLDIKEFEAKKDPLNLGSFDISKKKKLIKEYTKEGLRWYEVEIDITRIFEHDYLYALHNHGVKNLIYNVDHFNQLKFTKTTIKAKQMNSLITKKKAKKEIPKYGDEDKAIYYLKRSLNLSDEDAIKLYDHAKNKDYENNKKIDEQSIYN